MGMLWDIVERHLNDQRYPAKQADLARELGVSPATVTRWKNHSNAPVTRRKKPLAPEDIQMISDATGVTYRRIVLADLVDCGYAVELDD